MDTALLRADEHRRLERERWRSAAGRNPAGLDRGLPGMRKGDEINRVEFSLKRDHRRIENCPGGTHPGTEQGAMRSSLMLGMVSCMFDRLCLCQSADGEDTEDQKDRQEFEDDVVH
jgi:hypothetical protein